MSSGRRDETVSVIVPVHGRPELTNRALESVFAQDYEAVEVIVVDDASPVPFGQPTKSVPAGKTICLIRLDQNSGPGVARETGRQAARGEYIAYLDSDDYWASGFLTAAVAALRASPEVGMAYVPALAVVAGHVVGPLRRSDERPVAFLPTILWGRPWPTSGCLWRRAVCDLVGPWLPLWNWEDYEYEVRAGCRGVAVTRVGEALCYVQSDAAARISATGSQRNAESFAIALREIGRSIAGSTWADEPAIRIRIGMLLLNACISLNIWKSGRVFLMLQTLWAAMYWLRPRVPLVVATLVVVVFGRAGQREIALRVLRWARRLVGLAEQHDALGPRVEKA